MRHEIAVVVITVGRTSLLRTVRSIFAQDFPGRIQILIGVDVDLTGKMSELRAVLDGECPTHVSMVWLDLGYSTSRRHGGVHTCCFGGSLRSALTLLADSQVVMYLDDDDWLLAGHLAGIVRALEGNKWAFAYSWYCDGETGEQLCIDEIESVGVGKGVYAERFGGFVRPSGLAIDKLALLHLVHLWACSPNSTGDAEDRLIFDHLRNEPHGCTHEATVCCSLDPSDGNHSMRQEFMATHGVTFKPLTKEASVRQARIEQTPDRPPEALLFEPDWTNTDWVEVLLSYVLAFRPGEPIALILPMDPSLPGQLSLEEAQGRILDLVAQTGRETFPDVMLVDHPEELLETLKGFPRIQWVPNGRSRVEGLCGEVGTRFASIRRQLARSAKGGAQ